MNNLLSVEQFNQILNSLQAPNNVNRSFLYEIYEGASEGIVNLSKENELFANIGQINPLEIIQYCLGEYLYSVRHFNQDELEKFLNNEDIKTSMASIVADKYLSLSKLMLKDQKFTNKYIPPISTIDVYINFMRTIINSYPKQDQASSLIVDLLSKSLNICKCITTLLRDGFETEAFASWRTLHECECTLLLLDKYKDPLIARYFKHMQYGIAYRDMMENKDDQTRIFNEMKEEMRVYGLKSKDIKKYIEYGWMYDIPGVKEDENFKLNFRDGLEKAAGLSQYSTRYETSSEIIHSTPILIYSNRPYFHFITLLSLYESFFRLEKVFLSLFIARSSKQAADQYQMMRQIYYTQLVNIYKREMVEFQNWQKAQIKK